MDRITKEQKPALEALDRILMRGDQAKCGDFQRVRAFIEQSQPVPPGAVRFCRQCGHIGEVTDPKAINCCPEASPEYLHPETAQVARAGFFDDSDEQPQPVPEGYLLVPVEPTAKMLCAMWEHRDGKPRSENEQAEIGYRAMLAAAPKPEGGE